MKFPSSGSIRRNLALLVMVAVLPALTIILYSGMEQRRQSIKAAKQDILVLTHSMVEVQKGITNSTRQTLSTLALTRAVQSLDAKVSTEIFQAILERNPDFFNIALSDLDGKVLASGKPIAGASLADRKHVQEALKNKDFAVGEYVMSRNGAAIPAFAFAYPVLDHEGNPKGILTTTLRLDRFAKFHDVSNLPENSFVAVTDHRGIRLFYHPPREKTNPIGKPINPEVWEIVRKAHEPVIFIRAGTDGVRRVFAFEQVRLRPEDPPYMYLWAGIPEDHILMPANAALIRNLLFMSLATLLALAISWAIGKKAFITPIKSLVATTQHFAGGNLTARSAMAVRPGEVGKLARAFNDMADTLAKSQQTLQERESFIRAVLDNLPIGVAVNTVEPTVKSEYMNDNFPKFYRTTREALAAPDTFWEAVYEDPNFREAIRQRVLADCASGDPERMCWKEVPIIRKEGGTSFISARNTPILEKNMMISIVWDVTEQKQAEDERQKLQEQLIQAQKMESVGRLAGGVAHDFNNILSVILGYTELALTKVKPTDPVFGDLQEVEKAALRSAELVRQLLAFARKQTVTPEVLNLNNTLETMLKMLRRLIGEDIDLVWLPASDLWPVKMDPSQVDQIMVNICVNARDAIAGVGKVTIATENISVDKDCCAGQPDGDCPPGEYVLVSVNDSGCGMNQETLSNIFDPFFTTKGVGKGTGLGMATVFGIVKQNQGCINVISEPGKGTTFRIYLPRLTGEAIPGRNDENPGVTLASRGETVLLVEDDPKVIDMCGQMLENLGYKVLRAGTPGEALRLTAEYAGAIHLLLTDVIMPEMNGQELAKTLQSTHPDLKCLFMSGYTADIIANQGVLHEGIQFIQKPFSVRDVALNVRKALDQK